MELIERCAELEAVDRAVRSVAGGSGAALLIEAPAGRGKSALLDAAAARAVAAGWLVRRSAHGPAEQALPFNVIRTLLEHPVRGADIADPAAAPALALLRDGRPADDAFAHSFFRLCGALAAGRPLALLVDDAQWADAASLDALAHLARRAGDVPVLVLLAARPPVPDALAGAAPVLRPAPLSADGAARLLGRAPDAWTARCHRATGGDPWLLGELARRGAEPSASARLTVRLRLAQLTPDERAIVRAVSLLETVGARARGAGAERAACPQAAHDVVAVAGVEPGALHPALERLAAAGLCAADGVRLAHPLIGAAIGADLPAEERERLHRAAAAVLHERGEAPELVAEHLLATSPAADPATTAQLQAAASRAAHRGEPRRAAVYLERALAERARGDDRARLLLQHAGAAFHAGSPSARRRLHEAHKTARDARTRVDALTQLAAMQAADPHDDRLDALLAGPELSDASADVRLAAELARLDALLARPDRHAERARRVSVLGRRALPSEELRRAAAAHRAWSGAETGRLDAARCAQLARDAVTGDVLLHRAAFHLGARVLTLTDHVAAAEEAIGRLRDVAVRRGSDALRAAAAWHAAELALHTGQLGAAEDEARQAHALAAEPTIVAGGALAVLVMALAERGALDEAAALLATRRPATYDAPLRHARARLALAAGDDELAASEAREAGRRHLAHGQSNPAWSSWRSTRALALAQLGRNDEAVAVADEAVALAAAFGAPTAHANALHARAVSEPDVARRDALAA
jgi:hypothetical protein